MLIKAALIALILLTPRAAHAAAFLSIESDFSGFFSIGLDGVHMETGVFNLRYPYLADNEEIFDATGSIEFTGGELLDVTPGTDQDGNPTHIYSFDAGLLTIHITIPTSGGSLTGDIVATVPAMTFDVHEIGGVPGDAHFGETVALGPGTFDATLAPVLGASGRLLGGTMELHIGEIGGGPDDETRIGGIDFARIKLEVPEPATALLLLGGIVPLALRRRR